MQTNQLELFPEVKTYKVKNRRYICVGFEFCLMQNPDGTYAIGKHNPDLIAKFPNFSSDQYEEVQNLGVFANDSLAKTAYNP